MYGLLGEKLGHSFSKEIHESINNYIYNLIEVKKENLDSFMNNKNFKAINVTIPYKEMVIPYLSYVDNKALEIGAVNTIVNIDNQLYGYNTDYLGLKKLITKNNIDLKNKKILILGTGGTSKTAFVLAKDLGAKEIIKVSRKKTNDFIAYEEAITSYNDANIIINTTPCGMYPNDDLVINLDSFKKLDAIVDVIYNPLNTKLARVAKQKNIKAVNGLYMLVAQAVYASYIFINKEVDEEKIDEVYNKILNTKLNIALIGMPSCGKTTISKIIGEKYNCAVLVKGGHSMNGADDLLYENGKITWFNGVRIDNPNTHGTGCTLSSAIASNLAKGYDLKQSISLAKEYISGALSEMLDLGKGNGPMNHAYLLCKNTMRGL